MTNARRSSRPRALVAQVGLDALVDPELGENDRGAAGFLPPAEFEAVADELFAHPDRSVRGWETAAEVQRRIVRRTGSSSARAATW